MTDAERCIQCRRIYEEVDESGYCAFCWMSSPERLIDTLFDRHGSDTLEVLRGVRDLTDSMSETQIRNLGMRMFLPGKVAAKMVRRD